MKTVEVVCFIEEPDRLHERSLNGLPILLLEEVRTQFPEAKVVSGVGTPAIRQRLMEKASASGFAFHTVIHPRVERSEWVEIGEGTVICAGSILTTNIKIGRHVHINLDCTIGHDVIMADYATLTPGVHVSGCVHIGKGAYIGTGANIVNGTPERPLVIGDGAVIGAGACVVNSISPGVTAVGVPARPK
jgi:sugar O-acyltransferase (sialic acid O-acetyltransferase NeuD family)